MDLVKSMTEGDDATASWEVVKTQRVSKNLQDSLMQDTTLLLYEVVYQRGNLAYCWMN